MVSPGTSLRDLGMVLEVCFGWTYPSDAEFRFGNAIVLVRHESTELASPLSDFIRLPGQRFRIEIRSESDWAFDAEFAGIASSGRKARCLAGEGAMPDDWFGGNSKYADFLQGQHSKSASTADWYRELADEVAAGRRQNFRDFDVPEINRQFDVGSVS